MADIVNTGAAANDGSGDQLRAAFQQINQRFQQLLGTLTQITWAPGLAIEAAPARQWTVVAGQAYVATSNHTAGATFAADLADGKWLAADAAQILADLASAAIGPNMMGASAEEDYDDGSLGFLVVKNTSNGYNALRGFSKAEQALIHAGTSTADHAAVLDAILTTEKHLYLPRGTWRRSTKWSITDGMTVAAAGAKLTTVLVTSDVVGLELTGENVSAFDFRLTNTGTHTNNLLNVGTPAGVRCDRPTLGRLFIESAGASGIEVFAGNLGTLQSIRSRNNGTDGIRWNRAASADNHAWTIAGYLDVLGNGRDGFHIEDGIDASDAFASKCHSGGLIVAQSNGRYGVHIGSRANNLSVYAEANTTGQIYLSDKAFANNIVSVEGAFSGAGFTTIANGNRCDSHNSVGDYQRVFLSKVQFGAGSGVGIRIKDNDGTAGFLDFEKTGAREMRTKYSGSGAAWAHYHEHTTAGIEAAQFYGGRLLPITVSTWDLGSGSLRWKDVYADSIRLGAGSRAILTGSGSPEGVVTASPGAIYLNTGGGAGVTLYVKETGSSTNTGWVAK